jgi:polyisoprenoid-binding protein YceI
MKHAIGSLFAVVSLLFCSVVNAELADMPSGAYALDKNHGYITFSYSHLGFSTPQVGFRSFDVALDLDSENIENSEVSVTIDATSLDSRVEEFNGHLNGENFFDTENFPEIRFVSTAIEPTGGNTFDMTGDLTLKGTTLPVTLHATLRKADYHPMRKVPTIGVTGQTTVSRTAFGMARGVPAISDEVQIFISVELPQKTDE